MSDNGGADEDEDEDAPVVELGDGDPVEGAPIARVASRLFFPIGRNEIVRREGDVTVRTPNGPRVLEDVLEEIDEVYFETNADFVDAVESVVGSGPVPTVNGGSQAGTSDRSTATSDGADDVGSDDVDPEDSEFEFDDE